MEGEADGGLLVCQRKTQSVANNFQYSFFITMKFWGKVIIAFLPLLIVLWLIVGLLYNFRDATICVVVGLAISMIAAAWMFFAFHILND